VYYVYTRLKAGRIQAIDLDKFKKKMHVLKATYNHVFLVNCL